MKNRCILESNPAASAGYHELAAHEYSNGRYSEALGFIRSAVETNYFSGENHNLMGLIREQLGEYEKAVESYENAVKLTENGSHENTLARERIAYLGRQLVTKVREGY